MQIDFKALEGALAPIAEIGQGELTFDVGNTAITLRILLPSEEVEAQKFAGKVLESEDNQAAIEYLDVFRTACLAHAIVAVGDLDFRGVEFVETGETLENGIAVKVPKHKAMYQLLSRWTRATLSGVFTKFHELLLRTEREAEKAIIFEPANIAAEIDRLTQRIAELKIEEDKVELLERSKFSDRVIQAQNLGEQTAPVRTHEAPEKLPESDPEIPAPAPVPHRTGSIIPQQAAPPVDHPVPTPQQVIQQHQESWQPPPPADSSFINADDEDAMNASMGAEHQRLLDMRRRNAQGQPNEGSARTGVPRRQQMPEALTPARRRPPHLDAAEAEAEVGLMAAVAQQAQHIGELDGKEVYAMPAQDLEIPAARPRPDRSVLDPQAGDGGSRNPRFQSPRRP